MKIYPRGYSAESQTARSQFRSRGVALCAGICTLLVFATTALGIVPLFADYRDPPECSTCPCPPGAGGPADPGMRMDGGQSSSGQCPSCGLGGGLIMGLPQWWVSEPYINLRLEDEPLGYNPARGQRVSFHLSYRQRGAVTEYPDIFGVGCNWSCSFRAFLVETGPFTLRLHKGGAGWIDYQSGTMQYLDGSILTAISGGYQIEYPDGSKELYTHQFSASFGSTYFLTSRADPAGNSTTFTYSTNPNIARLTSIADPDGNVTTLQYGNGSFTNQVTAIIDPFSRTNLLIYDQEGYLTNLVDVIGLPTAFAYDAGIRRGWITNMVSPYGATSFLNGGVDADNPVFTSTGTNANRFIEVALPTGNKELFLYRQSFTNFLSATYSPTPVIYTLGNGTLDNVDQNWRNSFHWNALQYAFLSSSDPDLLTAVDYSLGRLRHWLKVLSTDEASDTLSLQREPTRDGTSAGQMAWYDYDGKSAANRVGTNAMQSLQAWVLPDGSTRYSHYERNQRALVTREISTYTALDGSLALRTNRFYYGANALDLCQQVGPNGGQVVSNYFAPGSTLHLPNATYDALNQETAYTYNSYGQILLIHRPTDLTTTNIYFTSGSGLNRIDKTIDLEISRTNAFTYYMNGLVQTHTDERGLTATQFWDNLQRLTGVAYPNGTTSNRYTWLDLTASKDRLGNWSYFGYNALRQRIAETNANGVVNRYRYCDCGATVYVTNAEQPRRRSRPACWITRATSFTSIIRISPAPIGITTWASSTRLAMGGGCATFLTITRDC